MKHMKALTKRNPGKANAIQDFICQLGLFLGDLLGSFGGASPVIDFVNTKCDLPGPDDGGNGTGV